MTSIHHRVRPAIPALLLGLAILAPSGAWAAQPDDCPLWFPDLRCDRSGRYEGFVMPITTPYLFEDPFITTNINAVGIWHEYPNGSVFKGGDIWVVALQARVAITDRLAFIATKDGYAFHDPDTPGLGKRDGFFDIAAGFKYALIDMPEERLIISPSFRLDIPVGNNDVFSGNGDGVAIPAISAAWGGIDNLNLIGDLGGRIPFAGNESTSIFYNLHLSYNLFEHFVPLFEINGYHWTSSGSGSFKVKTQGGKVRLSTIQAGTGSFEAMDVANLGSISAGGNDLVTLAFGARIPIVDRVSFGTAYEFAVSDRKDLFEQRVTMSVTYEF